MDSHNSKVDVGQEVEVGSDEEILLGDMHGLALGWKVSLVDLTGAVEEVANALK